MDPITALILGGIVLVAGFRTAGSAVTDVIAQAKGKTPPSQEKWRKNQKDKESRGEPTQQEPSPWKRRWQNSVEYFNAKARAKQQGRMDYLAENGNRIAEARRNRLQRRADRWAAINAKVAEWGDKAKTAHAERKAEKQAWKENERRSGPDPDASTDLDRDGTEPQPGEDTNRDGAEVLPFRRRFDQSIEVDGSVGCIQPVRTGEEGLEFCGNRKAQGSDYCSSCLAKRSGSRANTDENGVHTCKRHVNPNDPMQLCGSPTEPGNRYCQSCLEQDRRICDAQTETEQIPDHSADQPADATENGGNTTVSAPTHSGEITDLASALAYVTSASQYCQQIAGTFETAQAQSAATMNELRAQLGHLETAQSSLAGEGLTSEAGRLAAVAEQFSSLATVMEQVETLLSSTQDQLGAARAELDASAKEFQSQMAIAEEIQSHQSVAKDTAFYANA